MTFINFFFFFWKSLKKLKKLELSPRNFRYDVLHLLYSESNYVSTNLNIFETHPFTNSTLHLLRTISINKEIVAGRNIKIQVVIAHQKWPFLKCSHPVWISIMQVLLVCHKKKWFDLRYKMVTCLSLFFEGPTMRTNLPKTLDQLIDW